MEVAPIGNDREEWDSFARQSDDAWFWHTTAWMDYTRKYWAERHVANRSFAITENAETLAICPVMVERGSPDDKALRFAYSGGPIPFPAMADHLSPEKRQQVLRFYTQALASIAREEAVGYTSVRIPSVARSYIDHGMPFANPLVRFGYTDLAWLTQVIDLRDDQQTLWSALRKGHKADVKRARRDCEVRAVLGCRPMQILLRSSTG